MKETDAIDEYILQHIDEESDYLKALYRDTHVKLLRPRMASGHLQGRMLKMFVRMIRPRQVLEIGTYSGYSALCLAEGLEEGASVIGFTIIFWLIDKRNIRLSLTGKPVYNIVLGCITGAIWLGVSVVILSLTGVIHIDGRNQISMLWLWLFSAFINSVMQEVLVRGYLYQMIKNNYNIVVAVLISTGLFTFAHGGAFEAGILPVLNVITMSPFVTAVLEYTESLVAPIVIHFLWNGVGAIILGGVSLAEDYPHLFNMVISGNSILSGGSCKIEGSIVVLFMNLILMLGFVMAKKKRDKNL